MTSEEYKEMLMRDLLGELGEDERRALAAHESDRPEERREARELRDAFAALATAVAPAEPPAGLRAQLLDQVKDLKAGDGRASNVVPFVAARERKGGVSRSAVISGAIAASLVIAALVIGIILLWRRNQELRAELAGASTRVAQLQSELDREREDQALFTVASARVNVLTGTKVAPRASAILTYDRRTGRARLLTYDLPATPAGKSYQLWYIADGKPLSGGVFTVDESGRASLRSQVPPQGINASLFAITLEPQGGVDSPTGEKYLLSSPS